MNLNDDKNDKSYYNSEPGIIIKPKHIILGILIIIFFITSLCFVIFNIYKEGNIENSLSNMITSSKEAIYNAFNPDGSINSNKSKNSSSSKGNSNEDSNTVDLNTLSIKDYAVYCTIKIFETHSYSDGSHFCDLNFSNNNYTVYIKLGTYQNRESLNAAAVNASVDLYKALYTLCPETFGDIPFGVHVSGSYIDKNGKITEPYEVMFSWFDRETLKTTDINSINADNLKDVTSGYSPPHP